MPISGKARLDLHKKEKSSTGNKMMLAEGSKSRGKLGDNKITSGGKK